MIFWMLRFGGSELNAVLMRMLVEVEAVDEIAVAHILVFVDFLGGPCKAFRRSEPSKSKFMARSVMGICEAGEINWRNLEGVGDNDEIKSFRQAERVLRSEMSSAIKN